jgi:hypothetical protein
LPSFCLPAAAAAAAVAVAVAVAVSCAGAMASLWLMIPNEYDLKQVNSSCHEQQSVGPHTTWQIIKVMLSLTWHTVHVWCHVISSWQQPTAV